ncbi:MAG: hypothetical protein JWQ08_1672 [Deinococcus sp.]|nr:hypothetical protein [Deinococcus sp.]
MRWLKARRLSVLQNPAERLRLAEDFRPVLRILKLWKLTRRQQDRLLNLSLRLVHQVGRGGAVPSLTAGQLLQLSLTVGIFQALHVLYSDQTAAGWLHRPNGRRPFDGRTPLEYLLSTGLPGL